MRSVLIIGGGLAGLSAATRLAEKGCAVTVVEGRQSLGGRAYSFQDPATGDTVDNGQHILMGCYHETIRFLRRIGTLDKLHFQNNLSVDFAGPRGRRAHLRCLPLPAPWHLLSGMIGLSTLSWSDLWRMRHVEKALKAKTPVEDLDRITVDEWLTQCHQSEHIKRHLWDLITIGTLNEDPKIASAAPLVTVLRQAFFADRSDSRIALSTVGLSDLYVSAAKAFVEKAGGRVLVKSPVESLVLEGNRVTGVRLRDGRRLDADVVLSTIPPAAMLKLLPTALVEAHPYFKRIEQLRYAPIISIHLWFDRPITSHRFVGLLDTTVQWLFNRAAIHENPQTSKGYISLVISGAHAYDGWEDKKILTLALEELRQLFPKSRKAILERSRVVKEHHATLSPAVGVESLRPEPLSPIENFWVGGDWTKTGLPATIESACVSGHRCAEVIHVGH